VNAVELALEKQRLLLEIARQRAELSDHADGLAPLLGAADRVHAGLRWAARHPEIAAGGIAFVAAVRPGVRRFLWRWGKRAAFVAWQVWRRGGNWPGKPPSWPSTSLSR